MKYIRATEVLPAGLLEEIQKFAEGCLIYIPNKPGLHRSWGEATDTKAMVKSRNISIINDRHSGFSVKEIAISYHLAESTVKKIVYKK